jgi:hypothetical protein
MTRGEGWLRLEVLVDGRTEVYVSRSCEAVPFQD